ncbi:MAG: dihydroneopterin aldolase [Oligosphaeraceae bacterium]
MDDTITLHDLHAQCILGCYDDERRQKRDVSITVTLHTDIRQAAASDRLDDAINYDALVQTLLDATEASSFQLIEALAEHLAQLCLRLTPAHKVTLSVTKPNPRPLLAAATVTIERTQT